MPLLLLSGCHSRPTHQLPERSTELNPGETVVTFPTRPGPNPPVEAYLDPVDRQIVATGFSVGGRDAPCTRKVVEDGMEGWVHVPTDKCVRMDAAKVWKGLWHKGYEGSRFYCERERKSDQCDLDSKENFLSGHLSVGEIGKTYLIRFVGRKTMYEGHYGHMGRSHTEIIVDKLLEINEVSADGT